MHPDSFETARTFLRLSIDALFLRIPVGSPRRPYEQQTDSGAISPSSASFTPSAASTTTTLPVCGLFTIEEAKILERTLARALARCDFGAEVVIRLLNDKRSLFKSLLAKCTEEAHSIQIFDVKTLRKQCPRAAAVSDGVSLFFKRAAKVLEQGHGTTAEELREMCRANGMMHYRMKVWFQAENWLCVKRSVVDTILMTNTKRCPDVKSTTCVKLRSRSADTRQRKERQAIENVWMKLMQFVIHHMKHGFLEAAMIGGEEDVKL